MARLWFVPLRRVLWLADDGMINDLTTPSGMRFLEIALAARATAPQSRIAISSLRRTLKEFYTVSCGGLLSKSD
jgi:hypothetical protein